MGLRKSVLGPCVVPLVLGTSPVCCEAESRPRLCGIGLGVCAQGDVRVKDGGSWPQCKEAE